MDVEADFSKLEKLIKELDSNYYCDVGILGAASYEDGATLAGVGAVHEFGSIDGNIPQRSFIIMPITDKQEEIQKELEKVWQKYAEQGKIKELFTLIGISCEAQIQAAFDTGGFGQWKALKEATIGSSSILIDQGFLRKGITSKVGG